MEGGDAFRRGCYHRPPVEAGLSTLSLGLAGRLCPGHCKQDSTGEICAAQLLYLRFSGREECR